MRLLRSGSLALSLGLGALLAPVAAVVVPSDAHASVSIAVTFDALVKDADAVAVVVPQESQSVWEDGRIYTYTHVKVDQAIAGELGQGGDAWIRTMGGVVEHIGQLVDGEAVFQRDKPCLVFVHKWKTTTTYEVSARAQGQFPIALDEASKAKMVRRSGAVGALLAPKPKMNETSSVQAAGPVTPGAPAAPPKLAAEVMHDRALDDVAKDVASAWKKAHAAPGK